MGDNMVDKAKEKVRDVVDKVTGDDGEEGRDAGPKAAASDADREAKLKAAATGGTPDIPVGTEEDLRRQESDRPDAPRP